MIKIKNKTTLILVIIIIILVIGGGYFFYQYWNATHNGAQEEAKKLTDYISKVVDVPSEAPTVATIIDTTKLSNQTLQARSQNGDKLLIYTNAKRLILYRPSANKIVETLSIQGSSSVAPGTDKSSSSQSK